MTLSRQNTHAHEFDLFVTYQIRIAYSCSSLITQVDCFTGAG
jgi:hypothetical protein